MATNPDETDVLPFQASKASLFIEGPLGDLTILGLDGTEAGFFKEELWTYMEELVLEILREFGIEDSPPEDRRG